MLPRFVRLFLLFLIMTGQPFTSPALTGHAVAPILITGVLFNQPVDAGGVLLLSSRLDPDGSDNDQYVWDDFTLQTNEEITEIRWVGGYDPLRASHGGPVTDFRVSIYPSIAAGTEPAIAFPPLVQYNTGGNAGETAFGTVGTVPMFVYTSTLPVPFAASAGQKYWVQIQAFQQGILPDWGISKGAGGNSSHYLRESGAGGDIRYHSSPGDAAFTLLGPISDAPTDILLSNDTIIEHHPVNTSVGILSTISPDPNAVYSYSLNCVQPGVDDGSFNILGDNLRTSTSFDFATKKTLNICIQVANQNGSSFEKNFLISVHTMTCIPLIVRGSTQ